MHIGKRKYMDRAWLEKKRLEGGLSLRQIATECGCHHATILRWLRRFEMEELKEKTGLTDAQIEERLAEIGAELRGDDLPDGKSKQNILAVYPEPYTVKDEMQALLDSLDEKI